MDLVAGPFSSMVDALPGKLSELLEEEYAELSGNRDDVSILQTELERMRAAVRLCESLDEPDVETRDWANRVRELFYDIEDWVDIFGQRVDAGDCGRVPLLLRWLPRDTHKLITTLPAIVNELKNLKERILHLSNQWRPCAIGRLRWHALPSAPQPIDDPGDLVGLDGPIEEVANMVMDAGDKAQLKIVSIVGMAGSGKTTLANAVYKRLTEQNLFQFQAFMSVGHKPDLFKTLTEILSKLPKEHQVDDRIGLLTDRLRHRLEKKRYLIVVDDLWSMEHWQTIKSCFPENSLGSRIITATRKATLAAECSSSSSNCIYNIGLLGVVDSKKLIVSRAFGNEHGCPQHLEDVLSQIIRRCGGLPLALVTVASMLADQFSNDEWDRPIGCKWLSHPDAEQMMQIVNISYNDLPPHLRTCLLYLSLFPWNNDVEIDCLMNQWIAEGFIFATRGATADKTARSFLIELISRNMVLPLRLNKDGVECCRLHPVIHDFIVCKSIEENFVTLMDVDHQDTPTNHNTVRRLSLKSSSKQGQNVAQNGSMNLYHARSIIVTGQASSAPLLTALGVVRVLDLGGYGGTVCLNGLEKLCLLEYLSLRGTNVCVLPETLGDLRRLETLDVRSTKVKQLPRSIVRLERLRTVLVSGEATINSSEKAIRIPINTHDGHLQKKLAADDLREHPASIVRTLGAVKYLRVLEITWSSQQCTEDSYCKALLSSMERWEQLGSLTIHCGLGCSMEFLSSLSHPPRRLEKFKVTAGGFISVPKWIQGGSFLSFLQINVCRLADDDLRILRDLPKLQHLILGLDFVPREAIVIQSGGFSELWRFSINCPVPWLTLETGAMPKLTHLQLEFCSGSASEESVPCGIGNLQRLAEVALLYNQKWCGNSSSVTRTVDAVKRQVVKHRNMINLIINDTKADIVQEVVEEPESERATEIQSGGVQVQQVGEDTARRTVETSRETEIEVVGDNMNDA